MKKMRMFTTLLAAVMALTITAAAADTPTTTTTATHSTLYAQYAVAPTECRDQGDMEAIWEYMLATQTTTFTLTQVGVEAETAAWQTMAAAAFKEASYISLPEYWSFYKAGFGVQKVNGGTRFTFKLNPRFGAAGDDAVDPVAEFNKATAEAVAELWETGALKVDMDDQAKAKVIYDYVASVLEYDLTYAEKSAWESLRDGKAVCHGYVSVYNRLCRLAGVDVAGVRGYVGTEYHTWSLVISGGVEYHVDATWGDSSAGSAEWFWAAEGLRLHTEA